MFNKKFDEKVKENLIAKILELKDLDEIFKRKIVDKKTTLYYGFEKDFGFYGLVLKDKKYLFYIFTEEEKEAEMEQHPDIYDYFYNINKGKGFLKLSLYSNFEFNMTDVFKYEEIETCLNKRYRCRDVSMNNIKEKDASFDNICNGFLLFHGEFNQSVLSKIVGLRILAFLNGFEEANEIELAEIDGKKLFKKFLNHPFRINPFQYGINGALTFIFNSINPKIVSYDIDLNLYGEQLKKVFFDCIISLEEFKLIESNKKKIEKYSLFLLLLDYEKHNSSQMGEGCLSDF
jgi:hypothetical protein